jgi:dienelactone hydrolase
MALASAAVGTERPVSLGPSRRRLAAYLVPGIGWDCFADWLEPPGTVGQHVRRLGFGFDTIAVDSLSSSAANARQIRDVVLRTPKRSAPRIVLMGYSKGAPDILEAVTEYPEIRSRVAAIVSVAGAVGGSPLANGAKQSDLAILRNWPGARCTEGDDRAVESLRPNTRQTWLAQHPLPRAVQGFSESE